MTNATVVENIEVAPSYYKISFKWKTKKAVCPGHFVMLKVTDSLDPLLRRPFSVYNARAMKGYVLAEVLYKVVGKGTGIMAEMNKGDVLDVLGPLGKSFPNVKDASKLIMVAGGIGLAPFYLLARGQKQKALLIFGGRTKADVSIAKPFKSLSSVTLKVATEDGSSGTKGRVTDVLEKTLKKDSIIYACGPLPMLKAVAVMAEECGVRAYVSLESSMACGIGVCLGCAVRAKPPVKRPTTEDKKYSMVCSDGPVFDARAIDWEKI